MIHDDNKDTAVDEEQTSVTDNNKDDANNDAPIQTGDLTRKLRACRERAGLTIEQAAIEMRLSPAIVRALENEQFGDLPDPPYVRGYLRSYARLNDSDSQGLIHTYETLRGGSTTPLHSAATTTSTKQAAYYYQQQQNTKSRVSPTGLKVLSLVGLVVLLGFLLFVPGVAEWAGNVWQSFSGKPQTVAVQDSNTSLENDSTASNVSAQGSMEDKPDPTMPATSPLQDQPTDTTTDNTDDGSILVWADETQTEANSDANTTDSDASAEVDTETSDTDRTAIATTETNATEPTTIGLADGEEQLTPSPTDIANNTDPLIPDLDTERDNTDTLADRLAAAQAEVDSEAAETTTDNTTNTQSSSSTDTASTASQSSSRDNASDTTTTSSSPPPISNRQQPIDGTVRVRLEFYDDAWTQVKEGGGRTIFEALNEANTWKEFKYNTPLSFKIGNAENVKLYLNGQMYSTTSHIQDGVATFTVN